MKIKIPMDQAHYAFTWLGENNYRIKKVKKKKEDLQIVAIKVHKIQKLYAKNILMDAVPENRSLENFTSCVLSSHEPL